MDFWKKNWKRIQECPRWNDLHWVSDILSCHFLRLAVWTIFVELTYIHQKPSLDS